jgi:acylphosphatase
VELKSAAPPASVGKNFSLGQIPPNRYSEKMLTRTAFDSSFAPGFQPKHAPIHRCQCLYSGRVQGVGFRYTAKNIAMCFNVNGYVRNLPDGRVELVMEGPKQEIDHMVDALADRMSDYIRDAEKKILPATGEFSHFHIRH